ncbi:MAG: DUF4139 domain-containing protein [Bacteroidetes bacterium]|nr:MAG: DUF4139 domain-containing protein [Bacteroidota bacterium]
MGVLVLCHQFLIRFMVLKCRHLQGFQKNFISAYGISIIAASNSKPNTSSNMKQILVVFAIICCGVANAQSPKAINAKLQKVTVYLQGADLHYTENVNLSAGINEFAFENISPYINQPSLQASIKNGVVMDVKYELVYEEAKPKPTANKKYDKEIEQVLDSLDDLRYEEKDADNHLKALTTEKNMLMNNRIIKGEPLKDSLQLLQQGMAFLKERLNAIYAEELKYEKIKDKIAKVRNRLNNRHKALLLLQSGEGADNSGDAKPIHKVLVTVYAENPTTTQLSFSYFVDAANWVPAYDLQASSVNGSLKLNYFANVTQNTGLDWKNTQLTLSTSTPTESNTKPTLSPWYLSFYEYKSYSPAPSTNSAMPLKKESLAFRHNNADDMTDLEEKDLNSLLDYISVTENLLRVEYEIKLNYTLNSDGKTHKVLINDKDVPMTLQFAAVPKISSDAFLMARITGWEEMNIIPGNARLYFDGAFVGQMYLDPSTTEDTLSVNLGRDKSFALTRKKVKEKHKERFIGDEKIETRTIEIVVRNTKNQAIDVEVEDQIPVVSGTNEIKVVLKESDDAELDEPSGSLKWKLKLKAKETKKLKFTYEIHYPKDKPIAGL